MPWPCPFATNGGCQLPLSRRPQPAVTLTIPRCTAALAVSCPPCASQTLLALCLRHSQEPFTLLQADFHSCLWAQANIPQSRATKGRHISPIVTPGQCLSRATGQPGGEGGRQSVEAYLQQSSQLSKKRGAGRERRKEPNLPNEPEAEAKVVGRRKEGKAENDAEPSERIPAPDFQARSLASSVPEARKHEFADLETQTEWSYSSTSWSSSEEARRMPGQDKLEEETEGAESKGRTMGTLGGEKRGTIEIRKRGMPHHLEHSSKTP
ncbi:uncharacterized protein LOC143844037 [Paroedura picta]|uniref:uncharacterized protein LOC143844037 n=1 Tax=Paroedura picta TaxID=143630 RepID=UPI00405646DB